MEILANYGVPLFILAVASLFLYREVWPLIKVKLEAEMEAAQELKEAVKKDRKQREEYLETLKKISETQQEMQLTQKILTESIARLPEQIEGLREAQNQQLRLLAYALGDRREKELSE